MRALGREAIRLALRQVVRHYQDVPKTPRVPAASTLAATSAAAATETPAASSWSSPDLSSADSASMDSSADSSTGLRDTGTEHSDCSKGRGDRPAEVPQTVVSPPLVLAPAPCQEGPSAIAAPPCPKTSEAAKLKGFWRRGRRSSSVQAQARGDRESVLRQIGDELCQARRSLSLSIEQVHYRTHVPLHQVKALEAGHIDQLPEDIYIRGFVQRLGDALALEGASLASRIPLPDTSKTVLPSWQKTSQPAVSSSCLRPAHLYVGYAALMAGAAGGLFWMTWQPSLDGLGDLRLPRLFNLGIPDLRELGGRQPSSGRQTAAAGVNWAIAQPETSPLENLPTLPVWLHPAPASPG